MEKVWPKSFQPEELGKRAGREWRKRLLKKRFLPKVTLVQMSEFIEVKRLAQ